MFGGEHHAEGDEEVAEDFSVASQCVGEEDVSEFTVLRFGDAAYAYALEGR